MDPNFSGVWSASEIDMVKSFITSHRTTNTYINDPNQKHDDIVDELQARFLGKEKHQIVQLYVHLVVEMNTTQSNDIPKKKRQHPKAWTQDEHKNFLRGLEVYGRGNWKTISRYFVPTRTSNQICSHAQKYFHRKECTTRKQRFSINDVGLNDTESWVQENSSCSESLAFSHNAYSTDYYDIEGQHAHASQETNGHPQHIIASSSIDPTMEQSNSHGWEALAFTNGTNNTNYYNFVGQHNAMNNLACADLASNNQVATWIGGQQTISSSIAPTMVQNTSPSWEVLSLTGGAYNTNYYDFDGQQVAFNNTTMGQPW